jgi:glycosyltransferase involved in cell wall biosynthesis
MSAQPLVTVGIPTRNRAASLLRAVESVLAQDWYELEILISDNGSTDDTQTFCERLARDEPRVRYFRQSENIGAEANFREVLRRARGEFFMWLADDDWIDPSYVSQCASILAQRPDELLVCGRARYYRGGEFAFAERPVNLLARSGWARLIDFYRTVTLNGPFYGVMRRKPLETIPLSRFDWLFVGSLAYLGKIRTLENVSLHRSLEGGSQDAETLARSLGLSSGAARNWHLAVARLVFEDIAHGPVYRSSHPVTRYLAAATSWMLVVARFSGKVWLARGLVRLGWFARARAVLEERRRRSG